MAQHICIFDYSDYRQFLRDAIKSRGLGYRSFAQKFADVASFGTLASALNSKPSGKPPRTLSFETLCRIAKALKLSDEEIRFLIVLKLENDAESREGLYGNSFPNAATALLTEYKALRNYLSSENDLLIGATSVVESMAHLMDLLPNQNIARLANRVLSEAKIEIGRQHRRPGIKNIVSAHNRLERLIRIK